jgi:bifunctional DNA-binding transcriptional regulator/antitoxin component of YhaV-PrlF toxin-antitoxin module
LLEAANLKEGDLVEWVDQGDGSYLLKKHIERYRF